MLKFGRSGAMYLPPPPYAPENHRRQTESTACIKGHSVAVSSLVKSDQLRVCQSPYSRIVSIQMLHLLYV